VEPWTVRTIVRSAVSAGLAGLAVAATIWIDNPYIKIASAVVGVLAGYLGIGAASPTVEPFFGIQAKTAEVPEPPAVPES
jgi:hypothetical protein